MADANNIQISIALRGLAQVEAGFRQLQATASNALAGVSSVIIGMAGGIGFAALIKKGVEFNSTLEASRLGIAAIQRQFNGSTFATFEAAMSASADAVDLLRVKATKSPASFQELVTGFQGITGAATSANIGLKDQVDLIVLLSQALAGLGIRSEQLLQESRALITGNINEDAMAARILQITKRDIDQAKERGELLQFLTTKLSAFSEAGERGARSYRTALSNLGDVTEQALARGTLTIFDQLRNGFLAATEAFGGSDLPQKIDAFVAIAVAQWQAGRFGDFMALTIEAGFEVGIEAGRKLFNQFFQTMGSAPLWKILGQGFLIAAQEVAKAMALALTGVFQVTDVLLIKLASEFRHAFDVVAEGIKTSFAAVINWLAEKLENLINTEVDAINTLFGSSIKLVSLARAESGSSLTKPALTWAEAWESSARNAERTRDIVTRFFDDGVSATKELFSLNKLLAGEVNSEGSAVERINRLLEQRLLTEKAIAFQRGLVKLLGMSSLGGAGEAKVDEKKRPADLEHESKSRLLELERLRHGVESDFTKEAADKWAAKKGFLLMEKQALADIVKTLRERLAVEGLDDTTREQMRSRLDNYEGKQAGNDRDISQMGADPASYADQMAVAFTGIMDQVGTVAQQIGRTFTSVIGSAIDGIASSIYGLLSLTMTWGEALRNIGSSILQGVMSAISRMFAEWLVKRALICAKEIIFSKAEGVAKIPGMIATSVSSWGTAAIVGTIAAIAAIGTITAAMMGAFKEGGYTGSGDPSAPAGIVHRGEFVMPASATNRIGLSTLEAMKTGQSAPVTPTAGGKFAVAVFDDRSKMKEWLNSTEGKTTILDLVGKHRDEFI